MKIGILGCGSIAGTLAATFSRMEEAECYAAASRSKEKAEQFAQRHSFQKAYGSYEELVEDPEVELVYIATPHSRHYEDMCLCIAHKKPVLCEKAFTMNAGQAEDIRKRAAEAGVFVAEAIWTRYMPSRELINGVLMSGIIGRPHILTANLSYVISGNRRITDPELAGGALLDVGVYGLNFAFMHFGAETERIESSVSFTETGVDRMESITIFYKDGRMAVLTHGIDSRSDRKGIIYGDQGYLVVENINNPQSVSVFDTNDTLLERIEVPEQISGYEYEVLECVEQIGKGALESVSMPLAESIRVMETMDLLRARWGLRYPQEVNID